MTHSQIGKPAVGWWVVSSRIGQSMRSLRARAGWSRETLAHNSGLSWSAIAQIESGRRQDVRLSSLTALAEAFGVSVDCLIGATTTLTPHLFEHRLLTYESDETYLDAAIPYIAEGLERSECLLVVTTPAQIALLRKALDVRSEQVEFANSAEWYASLNGALNRYRGFLNHKLEAGAARIRILGDPVWARRSGAEITAWFRYESLVNLAFASAPATIVCSYDTRSLAHEVVADACRTHPEVAHRSAAIEGATYQEPEDFLLQQ
jgi:transcriptional regulator with XRE-family HTH domain